MAGTTTICGRTNLKKVYQDRSQPRSWYQQSIADNIPAEWFDRTHLYEQSNQQFRVDNPFNTIISYAQYDEDVVDFLGQTSKTINFNITFDSAPYVTVFYSGSTNPNSNIGIFVSSITNTGMTINTSAPYSGELTYMAVYSGEYPVYVRRTPNSSAATYYIAANSINTNATNFVATFADMGATPTTFFATPVDVSGSGTANVVLVGTGSLTNVSMPVSLSAQLMNALHYLVVVAQ